MEEQKRRHWYFTEMNITTKKTTNCISVLRVVVLQTRFQCKRLIKSASAKDVTLTDILSSVSLTMMNQPSFIRAPQIRCQSDVNTVHPCYKVPLYKVLPDIKNFSHGYQIQSPYCISIKNSLTIKYTLKKVLFSWIPRSTL